MDKSERQTAVDKESVQHVLKEYARSNMPGSPNLWPAIRSRIVAPASEIAVGRPAHARSGMRWGRRSLLVGGALVVIFVIIGLMALVAVTSLRAPRPVSAAEILARVDGVGQTGSRAANDGIQNTHMVLTIRFRNRLTDPFTEGQAEWWDQMPDKRRTEINYRSPQGQTAHYLSGSDGVNYYSYIQSSDNPDVSLYYIYSRAQKNTTMAQNLNTATQQQAQISNMTMYDAVLVGTEAVGGRAAYVLDMTAKPGIGSRLTQVHKKLWIDQQAYLPLREQDWDSQGNLVYETQYQTLEVNERPADSVFAFQPPPTAIVADMRPATTAEVNVGWQGAAPRVSTSVFQATVYPDSLVPGLPFYVASQGVIAQTFIYHNNAAVVIAQGPPSAQSLSAPDWGAGTAVHIGNLQGRLYSRDHAYILIFDREGTRILMYLPSNMSQLRSKLVPMANSLERVTTK